MKKEIKRLFKKEYSLELLSISQGDLMSAKALMNSKKPGRLENIIFLAQQSVEKSIKAVLIYLQISFPLVHDLGILLSHLPKDNLPPGGFNLAELNPYAAVRRYEEGPMPVSKSEVKVTVAAAQDVLAWAKKIVK